MHRAAAAAKVLFMLVVPSADDVAPLLSPFVADQVDDLAVLLEELVGHLEDGDHQPALGRPGRVAAAGRAVDEFARADLQAVLRSLAVDETAFEHVGLL